MFNQDPRFNGLLAAEVNKSGPAVDISILVGVSDTQVTLPISTTVPK
jgi:hypothetical protein